MKSLKYSTLLFVFFFAFLFRLLMLVYAPAPQFFEKYLILGQQLLESALVAERPFSYSPIYCYFIAFCKAIFGNFTDGILWMQIFLGSLSCLFLFSIAHHLCGLKAAWGCFIVSCCYHSFVLYETTFLSDFLGMFLSVFIVWSLYWIWKKKGIICWLLPGILLGFAILQRSNYVFLAVLILPMAYFQERSFSLFLKKTALFISSLLIILFPVVLQNIWLIGEPGITVTNPGYIFYSSNNYKNVGVLYHPPHALLQKEWVLQENRRKGKEASRYTAPFQGDAEIAMEISSIIEGKPMNLKESSSFYCEYAWHYLKEYPQESLLLYLQKLWFVFHGYDAHDVISVMSHANVLKPFTPFAYWWIAPLGILGIFCSFKEWRRWIPLYLILIHQTTLMVLFYVVTRFRLPVEAMMVVFAVFALKEFYLSLKNKQLKKSLCLFTGGIFLFFLCNTMNASMKEHTRETYLDSQFSMGVQAFKSKRPVDACKHFESVLAQEDKYSQRAMDCYRYLAPLYAHLGSNIQSQKAQANANLSLEEIINALESYRAKGQMTFNQRLGLADLYNIQKQPKKAQILLEEALRIKPSHPDVRYELACLQLQNNQIAEAQKNFEIAIKNGLLFMENSLMACFYLAEIYESQNNPQKARKYYTQALRQKEIVVWYGMDEKIKGVLEKIKAKN